MKTKIYLADPILSNIMVRQLQPFNCDVLMQYYMCIKINLCLFTHLFALMKAKLHNGRYLLNHKLFNLLFYIKMSTGLIPYTFVRHVIKLNILSPYIIAI